MALTSLVRFSGLAVAMLGVVCTVEAQKGGAPVPSNPGAGSSPGAGSLPGTATRPNSPNIPNATTNNTGIGNLDRTMFISGKVVTNDGTPPPDTVLIVRNCGSAERAQAYSDRKGRFNFQLGAGAAANGVMADASMDGPGMRPAGASPMNGGRAGRMGGMSLAGCELHAVLAGYRSSSIILDDHHRLDNPDVGTIVLTRLGNVEGLTISATTGYAPKDAKKAFDKGQEDVHKNKPEEAEKQFGKAVEEYPKFAVAWFELGRLQLLRGAVPDARNSFQKSIDADSKYVNPYESLARLAARDRNWKDCADITDRVIRLNPVDFPEAYFMNALAKVNLLQYDAAEKSAGEFVRMVKPADRNPIIYQILGLISAEKQDWAQAVSNLRQFIAAAPQGADLTQAKRQLAEAERMASTANPALKQEHQ